MTAHDEIQQALRRLKLRLSAGEIDEPTYQRQRDLILADLTQEERVALGVSATPLPQATGPGSFPLPGTPTPIGPSGGSGRGLRTSVPSLADLNLQAGTILLEQWRLIRELGRGGFGAVFEAEELHLQERQAVKVLDPAMVAKEELLARFRREVSLMRKLVHPRIVRVFDYREDPRQLVALISMELVSGGSVRQLLALARERNVEIPIPLALEILGQTLEALAEAHRQGVIHRDVTPGNVLLAGGSPEQLLQHPDRDPQVKLVDFGIAGLVERSELSQKSRVLGTAAYVAPEVLDPSVEVTPAADIYGAGAIGYEMLTGKLPLGRFAEPGQLRAGLPAAISGFVLELLEAEPAQRPRAAVSARELPRILEERTRLEAARREAEERARQEAELARHRAEQERLRRVAGEEREREEARRREAAAREQERAEAERRRQGEWARQQQDAARQAEDRLRQESERERQRQESIRRVEAEAEASTRPRPTTKKRPSSPLALGLLAAALLAVVIAIGWGISAQRAAQQRARAEAVRLEQEKEAAVEAEKRRAAEAAEAERKRQALVLEQEKQRAAAVAAQAERDRIAREQGETRHAEAARLAQQREADTAMKRQREADAEAQRQQETATTQRHGDAERKQSALGAERVLVAKARSAYRNTYSPEWTDEQLDKVTDERSFSRVSEKYSLRIRRVVCPEHVRPGSEARFNLSWRVTQPRAGLPWSGQCRPYRRIVKVWRGASCVYLVDQEPACIHGDVYDSDDQSENSKADGSDFLLGLFDLTIPKDLPTGQYRFDVHLISPGGSAESTSCEVEVAQ